MRVLSYWESIYVKASAGAKLDCNGSGGFSAVTSRFHLALGQSWSHLAEMCMLYSPTSLFWSDAWCSIIQPSIVAPSERRPQALPL